MRWNGVLPLSSITLDELLATTGKEVGISPWRVVTQTMIDQFADATDDHQWIHVNPERAAIGLPSEEDYVATYCKRRKIAGIGNWTFYLAFSFFRLAAICQGVYKRALDGNASNPEKAKLYGDAVKLLAGLAVRLIDGKE